MDRPAAQPSSIGPLLGSRQRAPGAAAAVKGWVRDAAGLGDEATVVVSELACSEPDCPPTETVISVMGETTTWKVHLHMPTVAITRDDIVAAVGGDHDDTYQLEGRGRAAGNARPEIGRDRPEGAHHD